jgi:chemotaxis protein methyltransferase CheR
MQMQRIDTHEKYIDLLRKEANEAMHLLSSCSVYHTQFLRDMGKYQALRDHILPEIISRNQERGDSMRGWYTLRIWSAGCAAGEEPYSIAMVVNEVLGSEIEKWHIEIIATDINTRLLEKAREGFYTTEELTKTGMNANFLFKYFDICQGGYRVKPSLRNLLRFEESNLLSRSIRKGMDIVFCRNVLIYFEREAVAAIHMDFYNSLVPNGYLFLGNSEILSDRLFCHFKKLKINGEFVYRKIVQGSQEYHELVSQQKRIKAGLGDNNDISWQ